MPGVDVLYLHRTAALKCCASQKLCIAAEFPIRDSCVASPRLANSLTRRWTANPLLLSSGQRSSSCAQD